jgi:hypothetical protein
MSCITERGASAPSARAAASVPNALPRDAAEELRRAQALEREVGADERAPPAEGAGRGGAEGPVVLVVAGVDEHRVGARGEHVVGLVEERVRVDRGEGGVDHLDGRPGSAFSSRRWRMRDGAAPCPYGNPAADDSPWKKTRNVLGALSARKKSTCGVGTKLPRK